MEINYKDFMERLKNKLGVTSDAQLAKLLRFSAPALVERNRRESIPYDAIVNLCRERGISMDYLITGRAEVLNGNVVFSYDGSNSSHDKMIAIPYFKNIRGIDQAQSDNDPYIMLPKNDYPELLSDTHMLHAVSADDDSMEGTIYSGALLLFDTNDHGIESGKIYIIRSGEEIMVKRLFNDPKDQDKVIIKADNIYYPQFSVNHSDITVIGRVVFVYNRANLV